MKKEKMNLSNIKNVLSRDELKKIMAGSGNCLPAGWGDCTVPGNVCCPGNWCNTQGGGVCSPNRV